MSASGDIISIFDGIYSGSGNTSITWQNKDLAIRSDSGNRDACIIDCAGLPGFVVADTVMGDPCSSVFAGLSFLGASAAISVTRISPNNGYAGPAYVQIADCAMRGGTDGIALTNCDLDLRATVSSGHTGYGVRVSGAGLDSIRIDNCTVRDNGIGMALGSWGCTIDISETECVGNGRGITFGWELSRVSLHHCRVDSSTSGDGIRGVESMSSSSLSLEDCSVSGNAKNGVVFCLESSRSFMTARKCNISANVGSGLVLMRSDVNMAEVTMSRNGAWGIGPSPFPLYPAGQNSENSHLSPIRWNNLEASIYGCTVRENAAGGMQIGSEGDRFSSVDIDSSLVADNGGPGLVFGAPGDNPVWDLAAVTIAGNGGCGLRVPATPWSASRVVVAMNQGAAVELQTGVGATLACCDIFGNLGGDWTEPIIGQLGVNANLSVDPLFCDAASGDYYLRRNSPLAAERSSSCGTIGMYDWNCPAQPMTQFKPYLSDVPSDQGGRLKVAWPRHFRDAFQVTQPVMAYVIERLASDWEQVGTMAAAATDTYAMVIDTPDVSTAGAPLPWSTYRIVATTVAPLVSFISAPDSAYSIDNLPPPKPAAVLVDSPDNRYIVWTNSGFPDFASACVFRGTEAGFTPSEPLTCPENGVFEETHLAWYFYRVQFSDSHGNLSEYSEELHGQWPTGVPAAVPTVLRLYPCRPNPFNPRTTIKYDLPEAGPVKLSVFDIAGRLVRTLVDESVAQGSHEAVWDGRDASGRDVGSGSYLARLEFGEKVEVVRMGLVR